MSRLDSEPMPDPLLTEYAGKIKQAADADSVRAVTKTALADPRVSHRVYHALGSAAREKIAALKKPVLAPVALADEPARKGKK